MKVAVLISGHLRCHDIVFPNFKERFLDRYQPSLFAHLWNDESHWAPHHPNGIKPGCPAVTKDDLAKYNPVDCVIEDFKDYEPIFVERAQKFPNFYHRRRNVISMFYKLGAVTQLMEKHVMKTGEHFDLVIRVRPDMWWHEPFPEFDPNKFYTSANPNHMGGGTGDSIQVGNMENMCKFSKLGMYFEDIYKETNLLCPHVVSEYYIKKLGFDWVNYSGFPHTLYHSPRGPYQP